MSKDTQSIRDYGITGRQINAHPLTVGREIKRNSTRSGHYGWRMAEESAILTLCERSVNYLLMARLPHGKNPEKVADMAVRLLFPYRKNVLTVTTDNGSGFACHEKTARRLGTTVCFAGSYASWQKDTVENADRLVRQYMPKGTDFREISDEFIRQIQYKINRRSREKLNYSSPKKRFFNLIA